MAPNALAASFPANSGTLGAIPDGTGGCNGGPGPTGPPTPRDVTFTVSGMPSISPNNVSVAFTLANAGASGGTGHPYAGDLSVLLIAPGGRSVPIFINTGANVSGDCGDSSNVAGPYTFSDQAPATSRWWDAAQATADTDPIPSLSYRASGAGGANTLMTPEFGSQYVPSLNGTWTLRFLDSVSTNTGSVTSATLNVSTPDVTPPVAPTLTATDPPSGSDNNNPKIIGTAEAGSTVRLYPSTDCTGPPLATDTAAKLASPGIQIAVPDNYTMQVRATATDAAGNKSACSLPITYAEQSSTGGGGSGETTPPGGTTPPGDNNPPADTTPPVTRIDKGPAAKTPSGKAKFEFSADEIATFECRLTGRHAPDDLGDFAPCGSPRTYRHLHPGRYTFAVRATDGAGNLGSEATAKWKVVSGHPRVFSLAWTPFAMPTAAR